jgi:hypothetical protein
MNVLEPFAGMITCNPTSRTYAGIKGADFMRQITQSHLTWVFIRLDREIQDVTFQKFQRDPGAGLLYIFKIRLFWRRRDIGRGARDLLDELFRRRPHYW